MADETQAGAGGAPEAAAPQAAEIEARARAQGWTPQDQWGGSPDRWVDAATYLKRADEVLPHLRHNNRRLEDELRATREQIARQAEELKGAKEALETLQSFQGEVQERLQSADEAALARQLAEARSSQDTLAEVRILRQLQELKPAAAAAAPPKEEAAAPPKPAPTPDWRQTPEGRSWLDANPWFNEDRRMRAVFVEIGQELAEQGRLNNLSPAQRLAMVGAETLKFFGRGAGGAGAGKVEGGRPSEARASGPGEHSFTDLPPDARDACNRQAKFLVGANKRFKDEAAWRKYYVEAYFKESWGNEMQAARTL